MEQITYLLFIKSLDDLQTLAENKANRTNKPMERRTFPEGKDARERPYEDLRWSRFKHFEPKEMFEVLAEHVFPFLRTLGGDGSTYAHHMKDARFTIPTPALLAKVVDLIDAVPMEDRDTKGDLYEYMLGKIATAGQNGQFRTPRHAIQLMVELVKPVPTDVMCDPAGGTCGFPVSVGEYLRDNHPEIFRDNKLRKHFHHELFNAFDFDSTMLRIGSMNMLLHGVEKPNVVYRDSLAQEHGAEEERYSLVLANPPFAGSLDYESCAKDLLQVVKTKKTELLFLALIIRLLKPGGRAAVIVPDGVLFGSSTARKTLRKMIVEDQKLDDKRTELLPPQKQGPAPTVKLTKDEHAKNNLQDIVAKWREFHQPMGVSPGSRTLKTGANAHRKPGFSDRTAESFCVPKSDIVEQGYDLSINRYKEVDHRAPFEIFDQLQSIEKKINAGMKQLRGMLK